MFTKPFISLYILPDTLYIVHVSSDRKKLKVHVKLELPKGLIRDYIVTDTKVFAEMLTSLWQKYKLKEKGVAFIVPEFAAFTKLLTLPKIAVSELHEAVLWQAQEFLPVDPDGMLLDWKITKQNETTTEVFVVAILKKVLMSYVAGLESAHLYPLFVEIPSLSLVRIGEKNESGSLFVYAHERESIIGISQNGTIVASSVVRGNDKADIVSTAKKITAHYKSIAISKVFVGGNASSVIPDLTKLFSKEPQWLSVPLKNLPEEVVQEFLLPISLATTTLSLPQDPFSINLLPHVLVEKYQSKKNKIQFWGIILTVTLFVWICLFASLGAYLFLSQSVKKMQEESNMTSDITQKREQAVSTTKEINTLSDKVLAIKKVVVIPQELLNLLEMSKPEGVSITSYKLDFDTGEVRLTGISKNRLALIDFKQNLAKQETLGSIDVPISNFETETNLEFVLTAQYKPAIQTALKKK